MTTALENVHPYPTHRAAARLALARLHPSPILARGAEPIRAQRGSGLRSQSWRAEGLLRLLENAFDSGQPRHPFAHLSAENARRAWEAAARITSALLAVDEGQTLVIQNGEAVGTVASHPDAPVVLSSNIEQSRSGPARHRTPDPIPDVLTVSLELTDDPLTGVHDLRSTGRAVRPVHWLALSGDPADLGRIDPAVAAPRHAPGLPTGFAWLGPAERAAFAHRVNSLVAQGRLSAPVLLATSIGSGPGEAALLRAQLLASAGADLVSVSTSARGTPRGLKLAIVADGRRSTAARISRTFEADATLDVLLRGSGVGASDQ